MRPDVLNPLFAEVEALKGVGPGIAKGLAKLGLTRAIDLAYHLPTGTIDRVRAPHEPGRRADRTGANIGSADKAMKRRDLRPNPANELQGPDQQRDDTAGDVNHQIWVGEAIPEYEFGRASAGGEVSECRNGGDLQAQQYNRCFPSERPNPIHRFALFEPLRDPIHCISGILH